MRTITEYRRHAEECRRLARQTAGPADRRALEELAETWERLAKLRERDLVPENAARAPAKPLMGYCGAKPQYPSGV
jgi:hypothetical protein